MHQEPEVHAEGTSNVQPSAHASGLREYKVRITFKNTGEDNIKYFYEENDNCIENNLPPHFTDQKYLLLHTPYNFKFTKGQITKRAP